MERKLSTSGNSLYEVLELEKDATVDDIRRSYKRLALKLHPDKNVSDSEAAEKFHSVNKAYIVLIDDEKREFYDKYGSFGLKILDQMGEKNANKFLRLGNPCLKVCLIIACILTGCCYCFFCYCFCCYNFCCGRFSPKDSYENVDKTDLDEDVESGLNGDNTEQEPSEQRVDYGATK